MRSAFTDSRLKDGTPLPKITAHGCDGKNMWLAYQSLIPLRVAELHVTSNGGRLRKWQSSQLPVDKTLTGKIIAELPNDITAAFLSITDSRGLIISAPYKSFE